MLPIRSIQSEILARLAAGNRLVLCAPPGSGKTTQVPQILLEAGTVAGQVLVLQPRRLAARLVAARVAAETGGRLGEAVGYVTRHDACAGPRTRVCFLTEGIFLRRLMAEPALPGVGAVLLDEFHERSLEADLALGLVRTLQERRRPDLKLVVMSATLDAGPLAEFLACPRIEAGGRAFPVAVRYLPARTRCAPWDLAADALRALVATGEPGDVLVFMPGAYEIRRTIAAGRRAAAGAAVEFLALHGALPAGRQDAALAPCPGRRKVIVATNVAETSITIEGIRHVIDSGLAKVHRYDPRRGLNVLLPEPVSRASADQRAGRAGRTAPGTCTRLWSEHEDRRRPAHDVPEVRRIDLAQGVLQLRAMGVADARNFPWLTAPDEAAVARAEDLLAALGARAPGGALTDLGRTMAALPLHPRLARMLVAAAGRGALERAALWAALLSERGIRATGGGKAATGGDSPGGDGDSDLVGLESAFDSACAAGFDPDRCARLGVEPHACREVDRTRRALARLGRAAGLMASGGRPAAATGELLKCLLAAFPDHVAFLPSADRRTGVMPGRKRVVLASASRVRGPGLVLALDVWEVEGADGLRTELALASRIEEAWLAETHPGRLASRTELRWNPELQAVEAVEERVFDGLVFERTARPAVRGEAATALLVEQLAPAGPGRLTLERWDGKVEQWIARTRWVAHWFPERRLLRYDVDEVRVILHEIAAGATRYAQVRDRPCLPAVMDALAWDERQFVESMAPAELRLPSGRRLRIEYPPLPLAGAGAGPVAAPRARARIQDLYGLAETPRVAGGRQKVRLEILAPNQRPVQVTDDLGSFWRSQYPEIRKQLARRYPKHEWR